MSVNRKYHHLWGTHCWYCQRAFGTWISLPRKNYELKKTIEHVIPKSVFVNKAQRPLVAACQDCNGLKRNMTAKQFALFLDNKVTINPRKEPMYHLYPIMRFRAWKIYNKTSKIHRKIIW